MTDFATHFTVPRHPSFAFSRILFWHTFCCTWHCVASSKFIHFCAFSFYAFCAFLCFTLHTFNFYFLLILHFTIYFSSKQNKTEFAALATFPTPHFARASLCCSFTATAPHSTVHFVRALRAHVALFSIFCHIHHRGASMRHAIAPTVVACCHLIQRLRPRTRDIFGRRTNIIPIHRFAFAAALEGTLKKGRVSTLHCSSLLTGCGLPLTFPWREGFSDVIFRIFITRISRARAAMLRMRSAV